MNNRIILLCVGLCVLFNVSVVFAQQSGTGDIIDQQQSKNRRIGSAAATELLIPVGARGTAMGGATMAVSSGIEAVHWNPAGLARIQYSAEALVSSMAYLADIRMNYAALGLGFGGFGNIGVSFRSLDLGDVPLTTVDDPYGASGRTYSPAFITVGLSYARMFTDAINFGFTAKVISEKMARATGSGVAFDLGVQYRGVGGIEGFSVGVALKNYGPAMSFGGSGLLHRAITTEGDRPEQYYMSDPAKFELPSTMDMGLTFARNINETISYELNGTFVNNNLALNSYHFGGEITYDMGSMKFMGRGGYQLTPGNDIDEDIFGPTLGFGLLYNAGGIDLMLDYCWRQVEFFDNNSMFALKFGF